MSAFTAETAYGTPRMLQPNTSVVAPNLPGEPAPTALTEALPTGHLANPVLVIVVMVGLAVLLTQVTVRGTVEVGG